MSTSVLGQVDVPLQLPSSHFFRSAQVHELMEQSSSSAVPIVALIGAPGLGKSTFIARLRREGYWNSSKRMIILWSKLIDQLHALPVNEVGISTDISVELLFMYLMELFGIHGVPYKNDIPRIIAKRLIEHNAILVLDTDDVMIADGSIHPALLVLLQELVKYNPNKTNNGFCIISSDKPADLERNGRSFLNIVHIPPLSRMDAVVLLKSANNGVFECPDSDFNFLYEATNGIPMRLVILAACIKLAEDMNPSRVRNVLPVKSIQALLNYLYSTLSSRNPTAAEIARIIAANGGVIYRDKLDVLISELQNDKLIDNGIDVSNQSIHKAIVLLCSLGIVDLHEGTKTKLSMHKEISVFLIKQTRMAMPYYWHGINRIIYLAALQWEAGSVSPSSEMAFLYRSIWSGCEALLPSDAYRRIYTPKNLFAVSRHSNCLEIDAWSLSRFMEYGVDSSGDIVKGIGDNLLSPSTVSTTLVSPLFGSLHLKPTSERIFSNREILQLYWSAGLQNWYLGKLDKAKEMFQNCVLICESYNDKFMQAECIRHLAEIELYLSNFRMAELHSSNALVIAQEAFSSSTSDWSDVIPDFTLLRFVSTSIMVKLYQLKYVNGNVSRDQSLDTIASLVATHNATAFSSIWAHWVREYLLFKGDLATTEAMINAVDVSESNRDVLDVAQAELDLASLLFMRASAGIVEPGVAIQKLDSAIAKLELAGQCIHYLHALIIKVDFNIKTFNIVSANATIAKIEDILRFCNVRLFNQLIAKYKRDIDPTKRVQMSDEIIPIEKELRPFVDRKISDFPRHSLAVLKGDTTQIRKIFSKDYYCLLPFAIPRQGTIVMPRLLYSALHMHFADAFTDVALIASPQVTDGPTLSR